MHLFSPRHSLNLVRLCSRLIENVENICTERGGRIFRCSPFQCVRTSKMQGAEGTGALNDLARIPVAIQPAGYYAHRRSLTPDLLEISIFIRSDCRLSDRGNGRLPCDVCAAVSGGAYFRALRRYSTEGMDVSNFKSCDLV